LNEYAYRQDDDGVGRLYNHHQELITICRKGAKENLNLDFPDPPELVPNNFYAGLTCLKEYCERNGKGKTLKAEADTKSLRQIWNDADPDYMTNSEAVIEYTKSKMPLSTLANMLRRPDNKIRYMTKGHRSKVHIGDFRKYTAQKYPPDELAAELADEWEADRSARQVEVDTSRVEEDERKKGFYK
jgi:hypothetical protein